MKFETPSHPKGANVTFVRTNADRDFDAVQKLVETLDRPIKNLEGLERYQPMETLVDYGSDTKPKFRFPGTDADKEFSRDIDGPVQDERWSKVVIK